MRIAKQVGFYVLLGLVLIFFTFPLYWIVASSFKERADVISSVPKLLPFVDFTPTTNNYRDIFFRAETTTGERAPPRAGRGRTPADGGGPRPGHQRVAGRDAGGGQVGLAVVAQSCQSRPVH